MVTSKQCLARWGVPSPANEHRYMVLWRVPQDIRAALAHVRFSALGTIGFPVQIYCNTLMVRPLSAALRNVIKRNLAKELKTWDGCFVVRKKRGQSTPSLHSWGAAIDVNAYENAFGARPKMSRAFVKCFTDAGLEWGGVWSKPDGMHFQLSSI